MSKCECSEDYGPCEEHGTTLVVSGAVVVRATSMIVHDDESHGPVVSSPDPCFAHLVGRVSARVADTPPPPLEPTSVPVASADDAAAAVELPPAALEWLDRLVYLPKREYAADYLRAVLAGGELPADPGVEWAVKARRKADRLVRSLDLVPR